MVILVDPGALHAVLGGALLGTLLDDVAEGNDLAEVAVGLHGREVLLVGDAAAADDADLKFAHDDSS